MHICLDWIETQSNKIAQCNGLLWVRLYPCCILLYNMIQPLLTLHIAQARKSRISFSSGYYTKPHLNLPTPQSVTKSREKYGKVTAGACSRLWIASNDKNVSTLNVLHPEACMLYHLYFTVQRKLRPLNQQQFANIECRRAIMKKRKLVAKKNLLILCMVHFICWRE